MKIFAIFAYFTYIGNITKKICLYCADGNVYSAEVPDGATNIIFNNNDNNQTGDLTIQSGKLYENGSWSDFNA